MNGWKLAGYILAGISTVLYLSAATAVMSLPGGSGIRRFVFGLGPTVVFYGVAVAVAVKERRRDGAGIPIAVAGCLNWIVLVLVLGAATIF